MVNELNTSDDNLKYYSKAIKKAEDRDFLDFLQWFNGGENIVSIKNSGYRDFYKDILKPPIYMHTNTNSDQLTALEIGCGGGRILNAACKYFKKVIGADIHDSFDALEKFMSVENSNFELIKIKDNKFDLTDNSIDFIYSFIVFQHILKIEVFEKYLVEINRILKPKSLAIIYFGRPRFFSKLKQFRFLNYIACLLDKVLYECLFLNIFKNGYFEDHNVLVNHVNLMVSMKKAKKMFKSASFNILKKGYSMNNENYGTQYYLIIEKK
jgi:ubiquinone/menaquinone biosynthesis C-methylase UbiE